MRIDGAERRTRSNDEQEWMRVARGLRALALTGVIAGIGLVAAGTQATPRVVADDACPYYAIDMGAFATCEEHGVAGGERELAEATAADEEPRS